MHNMWNFFYHNFAVLANYPILYSAALLQTRPQGMNYGVPFEYTLFRSLLRIRPQGMSYGVLFGIYYILLQIIRACK